ncbi:MAG: DNA polymerase III subunit alpha [Syntrophobacterales bacterium]|nr:MAG: DNA polymerase III subunit alpha [Syntrophobacterales bacterium]
MNKGEFVHLHLHSQYSLLDGAIRFEDLFALAKQYEMSAVALTDHGNMFGAIEFYQKAIKNGIKPIIGCEVYVAPKSRFEKKSRDGSEGFYHITLLARNKPGYHNLIKLISLAHLEGFYYKPRIDKDLLRQYNEGLIALSGCLKGEIPSLLDNGKDNEAERVALEYSEIFDRDRYFLEIQDTGVENQKAINEKLWAMADKLSLPFVATNDCHYLRREDARAHEVLLCIQTGKTINDVDRMRFSTDQFYFRSPEEMKTLFAGREEAITNTILIADQCNLELKFGEYHFPRFTVPCGESLDSYLENLASEGLEKRLSEMGTGEGTIAREEYFKRLNEELVTIKSMGFSSYFLIVSDFINYAKERGIPVGPGRGSAAGSLVAYSLGITDLDPLRYGLLFERFLNPERISMPDVDVDFCMKGRDEVIRYVTEKYGNDNVAQIITFGKMQAKAVVRDVGRALDMPYNEVDRIAKLIPNTLSITLDQALLQEPKLRELMESDERVSSLVTTAKSLEGLARHASTHAAGVVISNKPLMEYLPLYRGQNGEIITQYAMGDVEKIGLIKFDFLGLKTLTVLDKTVELINQKGDREIDIHRLDLGDKKTFELLGSGATTGIFQLESSGMKELLVKLKPESFDDIIALVALHRPGPLGSRMVDDFIKRKHGNVPILFEIPQMEEILRETYGVIVYQEQVMKIASSLANFSLGDADVLRRAMGKKNPKEMDRQKEKFLEGAKRRGIDSQKAERVFDLMAKFAEYGFNKSHSAAYALIAYQTAHLKAHYRIEFMAALLTCEMENTDKIVKYIGECQDMGIEILPPDVNESYRDFTVIGNKIRFGLAAVKNVGSGAVDSIISEREKNGPFKDIFDFCQRADLRKVNKRVLESLIKCGAFDFAGNHRSQMMAALNEAIEMAQLRQREKVSKQVSLFSSYKRGGASKSGGHHQLPDIEEWHENQLLSFEKETLGFYITSHPLARYEEDIKRFTSEDTGSVGQFETGREVKICGVVSAFKEITTRKGERMAFATLEDLKGIIEVILFPDVFHASLSYLKGDDPILVKGILDMGEDSPKIKANEVLPLSKIKERSISRVHIRLTTPGLTRELLERLKSILLGRRGRCRVFLHIVIPNRSETVISLPDKINVAPSDDMAREVEEVFGYNIVRFE